MTGTVLLAGVVLVVIGAAIAPLGRTVVPGLLAQALGVALIGVAGTAALWSDSVTGEGFTSAFAPRLGVDALSGVFLLSLGLVGAPTLVYACGYLRLDRGGRAVAALTGSFVLALVLVLCARDVTTFLAGWELMTLAPAAIILVARGGEAAARRTVFVYVAITHIGGAGVWIALLELASIGGVGNPLAVLDAGPRTQAVIAVAALVGFGTKAGMMPLHPWLPRAHPIAPAPVSALMSGVMVKVAVYGLVRVLVDWSPPAPTWLGVAVLSLGGVSALGGVTYALFARDLKRLLALSTIENVGIILLAVGASLLLRRAGEDLWAAIALAAAMLHAINHAVFKALLFLGAGVIERATGTVDVDSLGGLLRRMPRTGWALVVGAAAIAGLPPLNGFASEWLALRSLLAVTEHLGVAPAMAGAVALAALALTAALAVFCFVRTVGLVLLGEPRRARAAEAVEPGGVVVAPLVALAGACVVLGALPGVLVPRLVALTPGVGAPGTHAGLDVPASGSLGTWAILLALVLLTATLLRLRGSATAAAAPSWACGQLVEPPLRWSTAGFTKPLRLVLEVVLRPVREITVERSGGLVRSVTYSGEVPHLVDERVYRPASRLALAGAAAARRLQGGSLGVYVGYLIGLLVTLLAAVRLGVARVTGEEALMGAVQVVGGVACSPLLVGTIQHLKARLQGRRGPTPLQPYRELARLWRKSAIDVEGTTALYRVVPAVVAASLGVAILVVPVAGRSPGWGVGHDALALAGLLALARFAVTVSAWDTANGFALMGASRDLMFAVFVEGALVLALGAAALGAGTTDLVAIAGATAGSGPWSSPALGLAAAAFALVAVAETGRQPVDNPDTHLELTMIHEGPLLEYGGRDLAMLQWAAAARHWLVLVLAAGVFLPHPADPALALLALVPTLAGLCLGLAVLESTVAKLRILLVPRLLGVATLLALLAIASRIVEGTS